MKDSKIGKKDTIGGNREYLEDLYLFIFLKIRFRFKEKRTLKGLWCLSIIPSP